MERLPRNRLRKQVRHVKALRGHVAVHRRAVDASVVLHDARRIDGKRRRPMRCAAFHRLQWHAGERWNRLTDQKARRRDFGGHLCRQHGSRRRGLASPGIAGELLLRVCHETASTGASVKYCRRSSTQRSPACGRTCARAKPLCPWRLCLVPADRNGRCTTTGNSQPPKLLDAAPGGRFDLGWGRARPQDGDRRHETLPEATSSDWCHAI